MSKIVDVTVTTKQQDGFPEGTIPGLLRFTLSGQAPIDQAELTASFTDVAPGDYTVTVQRLDHIGGLLGSAISGSVTVPADAPTIVTVDVPDGLSISVR